MIKKQPTKQASQTFTRYEQPKRTLWWAAAPFLVVGVASLIRGWGIYHGDFSPSFTTNTWASLDSQHLWGLAWGWIGVNSLVVSAKPQWRPWRVWTAMHAFVVIMGWALLAFLEFQDIFNTTIWSFIALAVMVAWYWGLDPVRERSGDG